MSTERVTRFTALTGLAVSIVFAVSQDLSLAEFCWTIWLVGLYSSYIAVFRFAVGLVVRRAGLQARIPALGSLSGRGLLVVSLLIAGGSAVALAYGVSLIFGFYGIMLSVWVQLEPESLFGRNGFINSDFWTPVAYLTRQYWPLVAGQILSEWSALFASPGAGLRSPERQIVALHVFVLALPFVALLSYALLGPQYETLSIVILLVIKSLFDARGPRTAPSRQPPASPV